MSDTATHFSSGGPDLRRVSFEPHYIDATGIREERPNWSGPIASVIRASRRRSRVRDLLA
jgi:hypothetical protein